MAKRKNPHAVALGRKGGKAGKGITSEAKAAAARENGQKGGRPPRCTECHRTEERTDAGIRRIRLDRNKTCAACRDARAEADA